MILRFTSQFIICTAALLALLRLWPPTLQALNVEEVTFADSVTINGSPAPINNAAS